MKMNVLVTLNANYLDPLSVMLSSVLQSNPNDSFTVYVAHSSLTPRDFEKIRRVTGMSRCEVVDIRVPEALLADAPTAGRLSKETYYRLLAAQYLPRQVDRILYLDPDLVVVNPIGDLYQIDFQGKLYAAASHMFHSFQVLNRRRLHLAKRSVYVNAGVMMMNLELLRKTQDIDAVFDYIRTHMDHLPLADQDVLNALYSDATLAVSPLRYNMDERYFKLYNLDPYTPRITLEWVREHASIIHFDGKNKPWLPTYRGRFGCFYSQFVELPHLCRPKKRSAFSALMWGSV